MKEMFESLWQVAPRLMSVIFIFVFMFFICLKISQFYLEIENMHAQIDNINVRLTRVEQKVDMIIEYLLADRSKGDKPQKPSGR